MFLCGCPPKIQRGASQNHAEYDFGLYMQYTNYKFIYHRNPSTNSEQTEINCKRLEGVPKQNNRLGNVHHFRNGCSRCGSKS